MNSMAYAHILSGKASDSFKGRQAVIVTEDFGDHTVQNLLKKEIGLEIIKASPKSNVSDMFSSVTVPVQYRSREKLKQLAQNAMEETNSSIGIATAIYNGKDSVAPFLEIQAESLVFLDDKLNLELFERSNTGQPASKSGNSEKKGGKEFQNLFKKLAFRLKQVCPECSMPGWGITFEIQGLKCSGCRLATKEVQSHIWSCTVCRHSEEIKRPDGLKYADPKHCYSCSH
ncbi:MAG: hypothetical protein GVY07_13575 [Bacteroidetes bacterium]|jgi:hypothetical protein|nr:hypothetical protein [Bacteroidota bacterium]